MTAPIVRTVDQLTGDRAPSKFWASLAVADEHLRSDNRLCRAGYELDAALAVQQRDWDVCDEAASAETACDWGGEL
jgi:hypothetical protein